MSKIDIIESQKSVLKIEEENRKFYIKRHKYKGIYYTIYELYQDDKLILTAHKLPFKIKIYLDGLLVSYIIYNKKEKKYIIYNRLQINDIYFNGNKPLVLGVIQKINDIFIDNSIKFKDFLLLLPYHHVFTAKNNISDFKTYFSIVPKYNSNKQCLTLKFNCKEIKIASIKNTRIQEYNNNNNNSTIFELGKVSKNNYVVLFKNPLSQLHAFAIGLIILSK